MNVHLLTVCTVGLASGFVTTAMAQTAPRTPEGPGDIVVLRAVPYQNAILVGEQGRPTLVNPVTLMGDVNPFSTAAGSAGIRALNDREAADIVGSVGHRFSTTGTYGESLSYLGNDATSVDRSSGQPSSNASSAGGLVSGALGTATSGLSNAITSAFSRGGG